MADINLIYGRFFIVIIYSQFFFVADWTLIIGGLITHLVDEGDR
jgi:hypothetical protein